MVISKQQTSDYENLYKIQKNVTSFRPGISLSNDVRSVRTVLCSREFFAEVILEILTKVKILCDFINIKRQATEYS